MQNQKVKLRKLEFSTLAIPTCPNCNSRLSEEWEEEVNEYGEKTGYEFEIYQCYNCGYREFI